MRLLELMRKRYTPEAYDKKENAVNVMDKNALISEILNERARESAFEGTSLVRSSSYDASSDGESTSR